MDQVEIDVVGFQPVERCPWRALLASFVARGRRWSQHFVVMKTVVAVRPRGLRERLSPPRPRSDRRRRCRCWAIQAARARVTVARWSRAAAPGTRRSRAGCRRRPGPAADALGGIAHPSRLARTAAGETRSADLAWRRYVLGVSQPLVQPAPQLVGVVASVWARRRRATTTPVAAARQPGRPDQLPAARARLVGYGPWPCPLPDALATAATGDIWLFRGRSLADLAIRTATNSPVNHVGMAVALDDLPPLLWHAELGHSLRRLRRRAATRRAAASPPRCGENVDRALPPAGLGAPGSKGTISAGARTS